MGLERVDHLLRALVECPEQFLELCPAFVQAEGDGDNSVDRAKAAAAMVPTDWAGALLEREPALRQVRFRLVPRKISEEVFWARYFGAVFRILEEELRASVPKTASNGSADDAGDQILL